MKSLEIIDKYIDTIYALSDDELKIIKQDLEALKEKETPYELLYEGDGYSDGELICDIAICKCGRRFEECYEEHYNYCPSCGQKLKWLEENKNGK